ncbi:hypothetical protein HDV05_002421, partial [Chytridiales sp. JEL 0842]
VVQVASSSSSSSFSASQTEERVLGVHVERFDGTKGAGLGGLFAKEVEVGVGCLKGANATTGGEEGWRVRHEVRVLWDVREGGRGRKGGWWEGLRWGGVVVHGLNQDALEILGDYVGVLRRVGAGAVGGGEDDGEEGWEGSAEMRDLRNAERRLQRVRYCIKV